MSIKKKTKQKRKKNNSKLFFIVVLIIILIFVFIKVKDKNYTSDKISVIIQNEDITDRLNNDVININDVIYMSLEDVRSFLDNTIYQENEKTIITTSEKKVAKIELDSFELTINGSKVTIDGKIYKTEKNGIYLPISEMKDIYDIDLNYLDNNKIVTIDYYSKELKIADAKKKIAIKKDAKNFSRTLEKLPKGSSLIYISDDNGWTKVRTQDGIIGYVKSKKLINIRMERENLESTLNDNIDRKYFEIDISNKNINTYKKREKLINDILKDTVEKEYTGVKITCNNKESQEIERLKIEATPIFKECGISIIYN